ncbi:hypothetical protein POM88_048159 [Heracleum sosnowskyi]|uniref:DC1 domain-containing protein n=1 Tax=Heracleum sosnowskyi TaxID=360622 RepID=A0AAD8M0B3_9APIA|nr:hypothetical protein POM88_048159 [Heracleum sosnowskyi]
MKHIFHKHSLILNENYIAKERDHCYACLEKLVSCRSFIYSCSNISSGSTSSTSYDLCDLFLLHKTCAESPYRIENPYNPKQSSPISSSSEDETYPYLVHLPEADESSVNLLVQQFVKDLGTLNNKNSIISSTTDGIKHWAHDEHLLKLITINELNDQKADAAVDDEILLLCDGCAKPIGRECDQFYACVPCKYFLHKFCAELPREIEPDAWPGTRLFADKCNEPYNIFFCMFCGGTGNGIFFTDGSSIQIHIGCVALPKSLKHEIHPHPLNHINKNLECRACGNAILPFVHGCEKCGFYICDGCIMTASTVNHRWDSHPLQLIYEAGMVTTDHEQEFNCEYCSNDIDTNWWFYHCSDCDLSLHPYCFRRSSYRHYSDFKFGASEIFSEKLHSHNLTFVLNKKAGNCKICGKEQLGEPVLECAPCRIILCRWCSLELTDTRIAVRSMWYWIY